MNGLNGLISHGKQIKQMKDEIDDLVSQFPSFLDSVGADIVNEIKSAFSRLTVEIDVKQFSQDEPLRIGGTGPALLYTFEISGPDFVLELDVDIVSAGNNPYSDLFRSVNVRAYLDKETVYKENMNIFDVVASMKIARDAIREGLEATEPHAQAAFAHTAANRYFDALFAVCTQLEPYHMDNDDNMSDRAQLADRKSVV